MADVYEQNLAQKSSLTTSDYIRVVGSDNASYKQLVSDVAKKIIENYTGSSLAGSSQSVKSALDALNSKTSLVISGGDSGHGSEEAISAVKSAFNALPNKSISMGVLQSGDFGGLLFVRASATIGAVFYLSYSGSGSIQALINTNGWSSSWRTITT